MPRLSQAEYQAYLARFRTRPEPGPEGAEPEQARPGTEGALQDAIREEVRRRGWIAFTGSMAHRTRRVEGEPDFVILADRGRLFLVEAKTRTGKLSPAQQAMAAHASKLGHAIHTVRSLSEFVRVVDNVQL